MDQLDPRTPCIVSAVRTPLGAFQGGLSGYSATELGSLAIRAALERAGVAPADVDEVFMGNVISANLGQAPATQAALGAGLPSSVPCTSINKVCSSGLKAIMFAAQSIMTGSADVVVAGGMESMSNAPHYMPAARRGLRLGDGAIVDGLVKDGLWDPYSDVHMGNCAELCAERYGITRQQQDEHAVASHQRAVAAAAAGHSAAEIVAVPAPAGPPGSAANKALIAQATTAATSTSGTANPHRAAGAVSSSSSSSSSGAPLGSGVGATIAVAGGLAAARPQAPPSRQGGAGPGQPWIREDECLAKMDPGKLAGLRPYFKRDGGTVTAGNASPMTDGAAACVVASYETVKRLGLPLLAVVRAFADANQEPEWFTTAPALVVPKLLSRANLTAEQIDYWEINEAFSVVDVVNRRLLRIGDDRVNVHGGSVALGHPIGASGARILVTLLNVLRVRGGRYGCAAICNGGGGASGMIVELPVGAHMSPL